MALNSANVDVAVTGAVSIAPVSSTAPTTASAALAVAWKDLGYCSDDGVTETRDRSTDSIKAWQNADVVREVITESSLTFKVTFIETKKETVEAYYAGSITAADGSIIIVPSTTGGRHAFVIDVVDGTNYIRTYIPQGEITEVGDMVYQSGSPVGYECTIKAYPDSGIGGNAKKFHSQLVSA